MDVHKIAGTLLQKGITPDTIFLVWHVNKMDLQIVRDLLESSGYHDFLPPDENCITLIQLFRANMFQRHTIT